MSTGSFSFERKEGEREERGGERGERRERREEREERGVVFSKFFQDLVGVKKQKKIHDERVNYYFLLKTEETTYHVCCESEGVRDEWFEAVENFSLSFATKPARSR